jgi:hypothetical protein
MTRRITDQRGHRWPITGHRCPACRLPADPILDGQPHPGCQPDRQINHHRHQQALELLADQLGAETIDHWRIADQPIQTQGPARYDLRPEQEAS